MDFFFQKLKTLDTKITFLLKNTIRLLSSESKASLSLRAKAPSRPAPAMASSSESPSVPPLAIAKSETEEMPEKAEYVTGFKLHVILFGLTLVGFVIMLDQTIVATVSETSNLHSLH